MWWQAARSLAVECFERTKPDPVPHVVACADAAARFFGREHAGTFFEAWFAQRALAIACVTLPKRKVPEAKRRWPRCDPKLEQAMRRAEQ